MAQRAWLCRGCSRCVCRRTRLSIIRKRNTSPDQIKWNVIMSKFSSGYFYAPYLPLYLNDDVPPRLQSKSYFLGVRDVCHQPINPPSGQIFKLKTVYTGYSNQTGDEE